MLWSHMLVHCAFLSGIVFALCLCHPMLQSLSEVMFAYQDRLRVGPNFLGYSRFVGPGVSSLRHRRRFPWWGGLRTPRYHGPLGCLPKNAGRPMGPATLQCTFPWDFVGDRASLFVRFVRSLLRFDVKVAFFSRIGLLSIGSPFRPRPVYEQLLASFSLSLSVWWYFG